MRLVFTGLLLVVALCTGQSNTPPASLQAAQALIDSGRLTEARRTLAPLWKAAPHNPAVQFTMAMLEYREGYFGSALKILEAGQSLTGSIDGRILRAALLDALGRDSEAERELESLARAPEAAGRPLLHLGYGQLLLQRGLSEEALAAFDKTLQLAPGHAEGHRWRAIALMRLGRTKDAIQSAETAEKSAPASAGVHSLLLKLYRLTGQNERAAKQVQWLRHHSGDVK
jgi:tetratricopeptide (TPR) repeat protein